MEPNMMDFYYDMFLTDFGWVGTLASQRGLARLVMTATLQEVLDELGTDVVAAQYRPNNLESVRHRLEDYFRGADHSLEDIPLDTDDAPLFFKAAWEACRTIPRGETRSYAWLANAASRPRAFRAAGQAMARNPLPIVIPCHRVIGSHGGLHGYSGGLDRKARLLGLERRSHEGES